MKRIINKFNNRVQEGISYLLVGKCNGSEVCHLGFNHYSPLEPLEIKCNYHKNKKTTNGTITFYGCSRNQKN